MLRPLVLALAVSLISIDTALAGSLPWIFRQGHFSHEPIHGTRVAQYAPLPPVEALPDGRPHMSGYRRSRVSQRGVDGTVDTYYRVENWGNGRGGIDAEWERHDDALNRSYRWGGFGPGGYPGGYVPWGPGRGGLGYPYYPAPRAPWYGGGLAPGHGHLHGPNGGTPMDTWLHLDERDGSRRPRAMHPEPWDEDESDD